MIILQELIKGFISCFFTENQPNSENSFTMACQTMSWELALVTAPSSNVAAVARSKLVSTSCPKDSLRLSFVSSHHPVVDATD